MSAEKAVELLRQARDELPTIRGWRVTCGNLGCRRSDHGCGAPVAMWSQDAWDVEFLARRLEKATASQAAS